MASSWLSTDLTEQHSDPGRYHHDDHITVWETRNDQDGTDMIAYAGAATISDKNVHMTAIYFNLNAADTNAERGTLLQRVADGQDRIA